MVGNGGSLPRCFYRCFQQDPPQIRLPVSQLPRRRKAPADIRFQNWFQREGRCSIFGQEKARVPIDEFSDRMIVGPLRTLRLPEPNFFGSSLTPTERYHSFLRPHFQEESL